MTIQKIVSPESIETELLHIWEDLSKENKMRASLFNLIVFNRLSSRTDYIRNIVQKVVEKFPCRTLFISQDPNEGQSYLKTAVSVIFPKIGESTIACDLIDIGVAGSDLQKIPFLILPHLIPDLPTYVLWTEDPSVPHPLFEPLSRLATRIIFDSESADNLLSFAKTVFTLKEKTNIDVADLNWARTQGWRQLIAATYDSPNRIRDLKEITSIKFVYNARESEFFCHLKIQAMYLLAWFGSRLSWKMVKGEKNLQFALESPTGQKIKASIESEKWEKLGSGTVISTEITTGQGHDFLAARIPERYHYVKIHISSPNSCEIPYEFMLGQTATGQSLVNEICMKGTSVHYLDMLKQLIFLDKDKLC